jgi:hypothetical protein
MTDRRDTFLTFLAFVIVALTGISIVLGVLHGMQEQGILP